MCLGHGVENLEEEGLADHGRAAGPRLAQDVGLVNQHAGECAVRAGANLGWWVGRRVSGDEAGAKRWGGRAAPNHLDLIRRGRRQNAAERENMRNQGGAVVAGRRGPRRKGSQGVGCAGGLRCKPRGIWSVHGGQPRIAAPYFRAHTAWGGWVGPAGVRGGRAPHDLVGEGAKALRVELGALLALRQAQSGLMFPAGRRIRARRLSRRGARAHRRRPHVEAQRGQLAQKQRTCAGQWVAGGPFLLFHSFRGRTPALALRQRAPILVEEHAL